MEKDNILYKKFIYFLEKVGIEKFNKKIFRKKDIRKYYILKILNEDIKKHI